MRYKVKIDSIPEDIWNDSAKGFRDYTIYQTQAYQQTRAIFERQSLAHCMIHDSKDDVLMMCIVRIKRIPILGLRIGYVQWGPLMNRLDREYNLDKEIWRLLRCSFIPEHVDILRIVPGVANDSRGKEISKHIVESEFERLDYLPSYHTLYAPVWDGEDAIRNRLHASWRRCLNKAEKNNIEIREGSDIYLFHILKDIYEEARSRKGFRGLDPSVFLQSQETLRDSDKMQIIVAYSDGAPICAHASSYLGEMGEGILAASTEKALSLNASYLVWWRTLIAAYRKGMNVYNLGGIDSKRNASVYQFKTRLGGYEVFHIGTFEAASSSLHQKAWRGVETAYRYFRFKKLSERDRK